MPTPGFRLTAGDPVDRRSCSGQFPSPGTRRALRSKLRGAKAEGEPQRAAMDSDAGFEFECEDAPMTRDGGARLGLGLGLGVRFQLRRTHRKLQRLK